MPSSESATAYVIRRRPACRTSSSGTMPGSCRGGSTRHAMGLARRAVLVGTHDFSSFETAGSPRASSVRTVYALDVHRDPTDPDRLYVEVEANGFLYNMVRSIVGTLVEVGWRRARRELAWRSAGGRRPSRAAGRTGKCRPKGLFLLWVKYEAGRGAAAEEERRRGFRSPGNRLKQEGRGAGDQASMKGGGIRLPASSGSGRIGLHPGRGRLG